MDNIIGVLVNSVLAGGQSAMLALMGLVCWVFWADKNKAQQTSDRLQERLDKILEEYRRGQITLMDAIRETRMAIIDRR